MKDQDENRKKAGEGPAGRRRFLLSALRGTALGGLAAIGALAVVRSREAEAAGCERRSPCDICHELFSCERPEATPVREDLKSRRKPDGKA
jgi:hypothetical protein